MKKLLAVLMLTLCVRFVMPQPNPDAIPAYVLINVDAFDPEDPMTDDVGFPLIVSDYPQLGGMQVPPYFVQLTLTDTKVSDALTYCEAWLKEIDWEFYGADPHDWATDTHTLKVFTKSHLVSASGLNGLTREKVENYLNNWNATVLGIGPNAVVFEARIRNAIWSNGFWGRDVSAINFTEEAYDQGTGVHTMYADAEAIASLTRDQIAGIIINRGCTITNVHPNKKQYTFECGRDTVFAEFKRDVKDKVDGFYSDRKWYIIKQFIDLAYANGGNVDMTRQDALQYLHNRLLD